MTYDAMSMDDFVGLDTPPLDVGAFDIDMSITDLTKFFDEIDDGCGVDRLELFDGMNQCQNNRDSLRCAEKLKTKKRSHGRGKEMRVQMEVLKGNTLSCQSSRPELNEQSSSLVIKRATEPQITHSSKLNSNSIQKRVVVQALKASNNMSCKGSRPELKKMRTNQKVCDKSNCPLQKEVEYIPRQKVTETEATYSSNLNLKIPQMRVLREGLKPNDNLLIKGSPLELQKMRSVQHVCEKSIILVRKEAENVTTKKKTRFEDTSDLKFKTTQKRLHEAYEQAEISKKQRRIQIIDYVPLEGSCNRKNYMRLEKSFRPYAINH